MAWLYLRLSFIVLSSTGVQKSLLELQLLVGLTVVIFVSPGIKKKSLLHCLKDRVHQVSTIYLQYIDFNAPTTTMRFGFGMY
jgi:hypothetical protein